MTWSRDISTQNLSHLRIHTVPRITFKIKRLFAYSHIYDFTLRYSTVRMMERFIIWDLELYAHILLSLYSNSLDVCQ